MKGAIEVLSRYLAKELGAHGIAVNTVAPGAIATDFSGSMVRDNPEVNKRVADMTALGRVGPPDDIGPMIASLLSEENRWINGQRIEVSGGGRCGRAERAQTTVASPRNCPKNALGSQGSQLGQALSRCAATSSIFVTRRCASTASARPFWQRPVAYHDYFTGFTPVPAAEVAFAYLRAISHSITGRILKLHKTVS
jgi:hypothetical protein